MKKILSQWNIGCMAAVAMILAIGLVMPVYAENQAPPGLNPGVVFDSFHSGGNKPVSKKVTKREVRRILATTRDFSNRDLSGLNLSGFDLSNCSFVHALLLYTNLTGANLTDSDLENANLTGTNLTGANLTNVSFCPAVLYDANLTNANLYEANLANAILISVNLTGADFTATDINHTRFVETDVCAVNNLNQAINTENAFPVPDCPNP